MIVRFLRWLIGIPSATHADPADGPLERREFAARLEEFEKRTQWVLDEWYEKFSTLHARSAKQVKRAQQEIPVPPNGTSASSAERPSALSYRKPWSV